MKKLPIDIQTFSEIRKEGYIYVDKTKEAFDIINDYIYALLLRPKKFGKTLFLDTIKNIFEGNKELFKGLYIYDKWDFNVKYPVIKISWMGELKSIKDLEEKLEESLLDNEKRLGVSYDKDANPTIHFDRLIRNTYRKYNQKVVVLIDNYDKPVMDVIEDVEKAKEHRDYIKGLYSILKGLDKYLKFVLLAGVNRVSIADMFGGGLNVLTDVSLMSKYGNVCGYTEEELKENFKEYLDGVDLEEVKKWYNGYYFFKDKIFNPFDILRYLKYKKFESYWFNSEDPKFLIKLIQKNNYFLPKLSNLWVGNSITYSFDVEYIPLESIMHQLGYLTIDEVVEKKLGFAHMTKYKLTFPNMEVKTAFSNYMLKYLFNQ